MKNRVFITILTILLFSSFFYLLFFVDFNNKENIEISLVFFKYFFTIILILAIIFAIVDIKKFITFENEFDDLVGGVGIMVFAIVVCYSLWF